MSKEKGFDELYEYLVLMIKENFIVKKMKWSKDGHYVNLFTGKKGEGSKDIKFLTIFHRLSYLEIIYYVNQNMIEQLKYLLMNPVTYHKLREKTKVRKKGYETYGISILRSNDNYYKFGEGLSNDFKKEDIYLLVESFLRLSYDDARNKLDIDTVSDVGVVDTVSDVELINLSIDTEAIYNLKNINRVVNASRDVKNISNLKYTNEKPRTLMKSKKHNQSCKECKIRIFELLSAIYGDVEQNYSINIQTKLENYKENPEYFNLEKIYNSLINERGYDDFVKRSKLSPVDYYIKNKNNKSQEFILEFDESQHFTHLRKIALENYPKTLNLGFNREKWMDLCKSLDRHDIDPIYRDEQRAWYDTLRDFAPLILGIAPTVRLYASDFIWCQLNPNDKKDLETFKDFIESKSNIQKEEVTKQTTINSNENIVNSLDSAVAKSSENIVSKKETNIINKKYSKNYFLLVKKDKSGLYQTINNEHILVELDDNNNLISSKMINEKFKEANIIFSLDDINNKYLNLANNQNIFEYLVSWESELERIFNSIRYKYLSSVFKSGTENPSEFLQVGEHMKYNRSFQALAGKKIYQGGTLERKENSDFWKDVGFKNPKETGVNFDKEIEEFNFILHFLRRYYQNDLIKVYCELIAIKPGFHELVIHGDFFDLKPHVNIVNKNMINKNAEDGRVDYRGEVFALLRNVGNIENSPILDLKKFPADINTNSYFTYASCQVTEGPLVSRKNSELSYFEEIRKIKSKEEIKSLEDKFNILYYNKGIDSRDKLEKILKEAEKFRYFNN